MFNIRREQGRLAEVEGAVRGFIELYPAIPAWRGALALLLVELGRPDEARAEFEQAAEGGFAAFPRDANWLIAITLMAEVCGALGDARARRELYRLLEPYAGRNVVVGRNATCNGSRLAAARASWPPTRGEYALAERHFDEAQAMHAAMGARPWHARTQVAYAELLLDAPRGPGDVERATRDARRRDPSSPTRSGWSCWPSARGGSCRVPAGAQPLGARSATYCARRGEPVRAAAPTVIDMARADHRLRLLRLRRRDPALDGPVPRLRRVEHAARRRRAARRREGRAGARAAAQAAAAGRRRGASATRG